MTNTDYQQHRAMADAKHTPDAEFDRAVQCAIRVREDRRYARQCRRAGQYYDAMEAERDARWHERAVREIADAAIAKATGSAS